MPPRADNLAVTRSNATTPSKLLALQLALLVGGAVSNVCAQGVPVRASSVKKVDQGIADAGPLNRSLLQVPIDTRVDDGFQQVFEVAASPHGPVQYMRSAGGLHAVFPQSEYINVRDGILPVTPAGVVYWIGPPPVMREKASAADPIENPDSRIDRRVYEAQRIDTSASAPRSDLASPPSSPTGTVEDHSYRLSLLWRLAEAEKVRLGVQDQGETSE